MEPKEWEQLKDTVYPILLGFYEEGETYRNAEKYAEEKWVTIKSLISSLLLEQKKKAIEEVKGVIGKWSGDGQSFTKGVVEDLAEALKRLELL